MLSTMDPESVIFRKDYVKPKVLKFTDPDDDEAEMVDNVEGFFDGLPAASRSKRNTSIKFGNQSAGEKLKLRRLQNQGVAVSSRIRLQA